jgi:Family of unknown function (DUF5843)
VTNLVTKVDFEKIIIKDLGESLKQKGIIVPKNNFLKFIASRLTIFKKNNRYPSDVFDLNTDKIIIRTDEKDVKKGEMITLTETEQKFCHLIAKYRYESARAAGQTNAKRGPQSNEATDLEGIGGEIAFAKLFDLYPTEAFKILPRSAKEDQGDFVLHDGKIVDIKTTKYKTGRLSAVLWKERNVDLYSLMIGQMPSYKFAGFMTCKELCQDSRISSFPGRPNSKAYIADQKELVTL